MATADTTGSVPHPSTSSSRSTACRSARSAEAAASPPRATPSTTAKAPTCRTTCASSPGCASTRNITLKRGYTTGHARCGTGTRNIVNGQPDRRNVTIVLMNEAREPVLRWHAENAWINKIEGPSFKASGNEVAMESVELVHEGLTLEL